MADNDNHLPFDDCTFTKSKIAHLFRNVTKQFSMFRPLLSTGVRVQRMKKIHETSKMASVGLFRAYLALIQENQFSMKIYFTLRNEQQFLSMEFIASNAIILFRRQFTCCVIYLHVIWKCLVHLHRMAHTNGQCRQWCWSRAIPYSSEGWLPAKIQSKIERERKKRSKLISMKLWWLKQK